MAATSRAIRIIRSMMKWRRRKPNRHCERNLTVVPGRCAASNPEPRDSGSGLSDHPGMTSTRCSSVHARFGRDVLHVVGHGVVVNRTVLDLDLARIVEPGQRVLHPVLVVALGKILA